MAELMEIDVTVEIPTGSRNKYEWDQRIGRIRLDRRLYTATQYPADYGFINETMSGDGDPLDCLVLVPEATFPGCLICSRPIGMFRMEDEEGPDAKILAVPAGDAREDVKDIADLPQHVLSEISHFFQIYKDLEPGKSTTVYGWDGHFEAEREIATARERYLSSPGASRANA